MAKQKMSARQAVFAREYAKDYNGPRALKAAGYSPSSADAQLHMRLATTPEIVAEIQKWRKKGERKNELSKERILEEIAHLSYSSIDDYEIVDGQLCAKPDAPAGAMKAVSRIKRREKADGSVEIEFALWDKPGTLKLAGQHLNLYVERHELTGKDGGPIQVQVEERILTTEEINDLRERLLCLSK